MKLIGVAANRTYVNEQAGFDLLPDGLMRLTPSDYSVESPVFRILIDVIGVQQGPGAFDAYAIGFREDEWGVSYFGPGVAPVNTTLAQHHGWNGYGNESAEEGLLERDRIRPSQDLNWTSTDMYAESTRRYANSNLCPRVDDSLCSELANETAERYRTQTPNVIIGAAFIQAALSTDPADLAGFGALGERVSPASPLGSRVSAGEPRPLVEPTGSARPLERPQTPMPFVQEPTKVPGPTSPPPFVFHSATTAFVKPPGGGVPPLVVASVAFALAVTLAALYSRVAKHNETLICARRAEILKHLHDRGPTTMSEIARLIGVDRTTIQYHAHMLARASRLSLYRKGRLAVLALPGQPEPDRIGPPLATDRVYELLRTHGGSVSRKTLPQLASDIPTRTLKQALRDLQKQGRIERVFGAGEPVIRIPGSVAPAGGTSAG